MTHHPKNYPESHPKVNHQLIYGEFSLLDVVIFFSQSWKKLLVAGFVVSSITYLYLIFLGNFTTTYSVRNNSQSSYYLNSKNWENLKKSLPMLASKENASKINSSHAEVVSKALESDNWWKKNIEIVVASPTSVLENEDNVPREIMGFKIIGDGTSAEASFNNAKYAADFLRIGGAYVELQKILKDYSLKISSEGISANNKINSLEIGRSYLKERIRLFEGLLKRFPSGNNVNQILDINSSNAKYSSIANQIIAANADINSANEDIDRLNNNLRVLKMYEDFLEKAEPLMAQGFDGVALSMDMLKIIGGMRDRWTKNDASTRLALGQIEERIIQVQTSFQGISFNGAETRRKIGIRSALPVSFIAGVISMALILLGRIFCNQVGDLWGKRIEAKTGVQD